MYTFPERAVISTLAHCELNIFVGCWPFPSVMLRHPLPVAHCVPLPWRRLVCYCGCLRWTRLIQCIWGSIVVHVFSIPGDISMSLITETFHVIRPHDLMNIRIIQYHRIHRQLCCCSSKRSHASRYPVHYQPWTNWHSLVIQVHTCQNPVQSPRPICARL